MVRINKKGFTLLEMLVVTAIIIILLSLVIPSASSALSETKSAACAANRRNAETLLQSKILLNELDPNEIQQALDDLDMKCPSNGIYHAKYNDETGTVTVECTKHTQTITQGVLSEFTQMCKNYADYASYKSNDKMRDAIYTQLGGKWNTIGFEDDDTEYYIQPYWNTASDEMYIFASTQSDTRGNWYTGYIYNSETSTWYHGSAFSFVGKYTSWEDVWNEMQSKGWEAVDVHYEK